LDGHRVLLSTLGTRVRASRSIIERDAHPPTEVGRGSVCDASDVGFTRADLERFRGRPVDDLIGPAPRLLFVGINPSLWTAAVNAHFARPGNRFWPALHRAGIVERPIDASAGLSVDDVVHLQVRGVAITNLVNSATARADELSVDQLRAGADRLRATVRRVRPRVVAVLGLTAYRAAFGVRGGTPGRQPEQLEDAELWVLPNPSGLNAHETLDSLAAAYASAARAAGISLRSIPRRGDR
jgi:TDG/mug DNA glycosylase family protein